MNLKVINKSKIKNFDSYMEKARAIILNEKNEIYICNMNGSYQLPGGTIENNEVPLETLKRELKEELGLIINDNLEELIHIKYYHKQFPKYKSEGFDNRLNSVYYYLIHINSNQINNSDFTDYEIANNIKIEVLKIAELKALIKKSNSNIDNKWKKFTDLELESILNYYNVLTNNNYIV